MKQYIVSKKHIIFLFILFAVFLTTGGYLIYDLESNSIRDLQKKELSTVSEFKSKLLSAWFSDELSDAYLISRDLLTVEYIENWISNRTNSDKLTLLKLFNSLKEQHDYAGIFLFTDTGKFLISTRDSLLDIYTHYSKIFPSIIKSGFIQSTDIYFKKNEHRFYQDFIAPIINTDENVIAFLILQIDASSNLTKLIQYQPLHSKNAESYLTIVKNDSIYILSSIQASSGVFVNKNYFGSDSRPEIIASNNRTGIVDGKNMRGDDVLAHISIIPESNWRLITQINKSELDNELIQSTITIALITVLLVLLTGLALAVLYNNRQKNILTELYQSKYNYFTSLEKFKVTLDSIGDGVITADMNRKVDYMNKIAEKLTGWSFKEALGEDIEDVYRINNEKTGKRVTGFAEKILQLGTVKDLANNTLLCSKSGEMIPVLDVGAPIRDTQGNIIGVALAFRDETEKRQQQIKIIKNEARLRSTLDNMLEGCQIIDKNWKYIYINDTAASHGRSTKDKLLGKSMMEVYPGIENTELFSLLTDTLTNGSVHLIENEFTFPDGSKGWFELSIQPVPEGIFILSQDITNRKIAEQDLIESSKLIRRLNRVYAVLSNINQLIVRERDENKILNQACKIAVEDGKFLMAWIALTDEENQSLKPVAQYGRIGSYLTNLKIDLSDKREKLCITGEAVKYQKYSVSNDIINDDKMKLWKEEAVKNNYRSCASFPLVVFGKSFGAFSLYSDVVNFFDEEEIKLLDELSKDISFALETLIIERDKVQFENKLNESNKRFQRLVNELNDIVWTISIDTLEIIDINEAFTEIYGIPTDELKKNSKLWFEMVHPEDRKIAEESNKQLMSEGYAEAEYRIIRPDGRVRWLLDRKSLIYDLEGKPIQFGGIAQDITDKKQMYFDLVAAKDQAEEMNRIKSNFFSNMSHELRTPLIGILGFSEILLDTHIQDQETAEMIKQIHLGGERLLHTLNLILNISKLESSKPGVHLRSTDIITLLKESYHLFSAVARKKDINYTFTSDSDTLFCDVDKDLFSNIFNNLINNAIKFTDKGSVSLQVKSSNQKAIIQIMDTGIGIPPDRIEIIWDEFRQASEGFNRKFEGTGLGLTISKKYTELMNGNISVESSLNEGSIFTVEFPLSDNLISVNDPSDELLITHEKLIPENSTNKKILFVEDDDITQKFVSQILHNIYEIDVTGDSKTALNKVSEKQYDLILMDINLGDGISGIELTSRIRKISSYKHIPIIALTAYAMPQDKNKIISQGLNDYLSKPFNKIDLIKIIQLHLEKYKTNK